MASTDRLTGTQTVLKNQHLARMPLLDFAALTRVFSVQGAFFEPRQSITPLSSQISTFTPYTYFASTAYCPPSLTISWSCGGICPVPREELRSDVLPKSQLPS